MREFCRRCRDRANDLSLEERPYIPFADFIVWGKMFDPEALGPRCWNCAADQIGVQALVGAGQYAVYDLRPVYAALDAAATIRHSLDDGMAALNALAGVAKAYGGGE